MTEEEARETLPEGSLGPVSKARRLPPPCVHLDLWSLIGPPVLGLQTYKHNCLGKPSVQKPSEFGTSFQGSLSTTRLRTLPCTLGPVVVNRPSSTVLGFKTNTLALKGSHPFKNVAKLRILLGSLGVWDQFPRPAVYHWLVYTRTCGR